MQNCILNSLLSTFLYGNLSTQNNNTIKAMLSVRFLKCFKKQFDAIEE